MSTVLIWTYLLASITIAVAGMVGFIRVSRGSVVAGGNGEPTPRWLHVFCIGLGTLGILSSAPSILSDNPHWFVDKIYFLISKLIELIADNTL